MFLNSAAILVRSSFDVVRITLDNSRSNFNERVDRLEDPINVAKGFWGDDDSFVPEGDSQIPLDEVAGHVSEVQHNRTTSKTHLWHDTSTLPDSTRSIQLRDPIRPLRLSNPDAVEPNLYGIAIPTTCTLRGSTSIRPLNHKTHWPVEKHPIVPGQPGQTHARILVDHNPHLWSRSDDPVRRFPFQHRLFIRMVQPKVPTRQIHLSLPLHRLGSLQEFPYAPFFLFHP